jgi:hypothetical protein
LVQSKKVTLPTLISGHLHVNTLLKVTLALNVNTDKYLFRATSICNILKMLTIISDQYNV